jgi:hypothetical protein
MMVHRLDHALAVFPVEPSGARWTMTTLCMTTPMGSSATLVGSADGSSAWQQDAYKGHLLSVGNSISYCIPVFAFTRRAESASDYFSLCTFLW